MNDLFVKMLLHLFRKSRAEVLARTAERKSRKGSTRRRGRGFRRASRFTSPLDLKPRIEAPRKSCRSPSGPYKGPFTCAFLDNKAAIEGLRP